MYYDPSLGRQGNIEKLYQENQYRSNEIFNNKNSYDADHIVMEQAHTDAELNDIEVNQLITELDLRVMELEAK